MPDVFENFFSDFNKKVSDYYFLKKLDPAYEVYFSDGKSIKIGDTLEKIYSAFENEEKGSSVKLKKFIKNAEENYNIAVKDLVYNMPGISPLELVTLETIKKIGYFMSTIKKEVNREFTNPKLSQILQFPVLFLGAKPSATPAFYNFMNNYLKQFITDRLPTVEEDAAVFDLSEARSAKAQKFLQDNKLS